MFELIQPGTKVDFMGKRHYWIGISVVCIAASILLFLTKGLNYGIDFTGGAEVQVRVPATWEIGKVRSEMEAGDVKGLHVVQIGEPAAHEFLVKAQGDEGSLNQISKQVSDILSKTLKAGEFEIKRVDVVGPAAGGSLRKSGFLSMLYALLCILVYVSIRFDMRYSPGAVLALFHDSVITIGILVVLQKQFDLLTLAAMLALIGYSNNDTIIVFDRVRETLHQHPTLKIEDAVNRATNETLGRTILTSLCTFFTAFALWAFGGPVIHDFAFIFMIGIVVGTYSSIFIASSLVVFLTHYNEKKMATTQVKVKSKKQISVRPEPKFQ